MKFEEIIDSFSRTTDEILSLSRFREKLAKNRPLRIKYGVDVTAPFLHIGHAVNLWMMRDLQELGHKVVFLIGDFTTRIGDPTGRSSTRPVLTLAEIEANAQEFIKQVSMVLKTTPDVFEVRRNSEWFDKMPTGEFLNLLAMVTHGRLMSRDMFQKRIENSQEIYMHELIYPLLQGYDSVMLNSDLTIIGSDQLFNESMGCFYQEKFNSDPQVIITTKITAGIDGKAKQSKSLGNYVALGHSPRDKFGRIMSIPDNLIEPYLWVYTKLPSEQVKQICSTIAEQPMAAKKYLATQIVALYHGEQVAEQELTWFTNVFSEKAIPTDMPVITIASKNITNFDMLRQCFNPQEISNGQLRRLFEQGAITINNQKLLLQQNIEVQGNELIIKAGKRQWFKVIFSE